MINRDGTKTRHIRMFTACTLAAAAFTLVSARASAQAPQDDRPTDTPPQDAAPAQSMPQGGGGRVQGFQILPTIDNTYVVTHDLRGLLCLADVGTQNSCAIIRPEGNSTYPWDKVQCKRSDPSVSTFAWSLDNNRAVSIFDAPPALTMGAKTYGINVRLGRVCMKPGTVGGKK